MIVFFSKRIRYNGVILSAILVCNRPVKMWSAYTQRPNRYPRFLRNDTEYRNIPNTDNWIPNICVGQLLYIRDIYSISYNHALMQIAEVW